MAIVYFSRMRLYNIGLFLCIYMFEERQRVELQRGHRVETGEGEREGEREADERVGLYSVRGVQNPEFQIDIF